MSQTTELTNLLENILEQTADLRVQVDQVRTLVPRELISSLNKKVDSLVDAVDRLRVVDPAGNSLQHRAGRPCGRIYSSVVDYGLHDNKLY